MLGHYIGSGAQIGINYYCNKMIKSPTFCSTTSYIMHEAIIEPIVDYISYRLVLPINPTNGEIFVPGKIVLGVATSFMFSKGANYFIDENPVIDTMTGFVGGLIGDCIYSYYQAE